MKAGRHDPSLADKLLKTHYDSRLFLGTDADVVRSVRVLRHDEVGQRRRLPQRVPRRSVHEPAYFARTGQPVRGRQKGVEGGQSAPRRHHQSDAVQQNRRRSRPVYGPEQTVQTGRAGPRRRAQLQQDIESKFIHFEQRLQNISKIDGKSLEERARHSLNIIISIRL